MKITANGTLKSWHHRWRHTRSL